MKNLTINQVLKAINAHPYILLRHQYGYLIAVNRNILKTKENKKRLLLVNHNSLSSYCSFVSCDFQSYLFYKTPFIQQQKKK